MSPGARPAKTRLFGALKKPRANVADPTANQHGDAFSVCDAEAQLTVEQREVVRLVLVEAISYKGGRRDHRRPIGTITSRLARGRDSLQGGGGMLGNGRGRPHDPFPDEVLPAYADGRWGHRDP